MKFTTQILFILVFSFFILLFSNCKKSNSNSANGDIIPSQFSNLVPQSLIDSLRSVGVTINTGTTPPLVNGIYLFSPDSCTYDNSPANSKGQLYVPYSFQFSAQNNTTYTLTIAQKNLSSGVLNPLPVYTYISGSGNSFSIFAIRTSSASGVPASLYNIFSGTLTSKGIANFQNTLYVRSKNDPNNTIAPVGTIRIFVVGGAGTGTILSSF